METIIYKNHCNICNKNIYHKERVELCPNCNENIFEYTKLENPISKPKHKSLIIIKTKDKLSPQNYKQDDILHIGITDSKCKFYNFWFKYKIEDLGNTPTVSIKLDDLTLSDEEFDSLLEYNMSEQVNDYGQYHEITNNCFDYVSRFFDFIKYQGIKWTKENLAFSLIEKKMIYFEKYCDIYQKLISDDILIEDSNIVYTCSVCDVCNKRIVEGEKNRCLECNDFDICDECFGKVGHIHKTVKV